MWLFLLLNWVLFSSCDIYLGENDSGNTIANFRECFSSEDYKCFVVSNNYVAPPETDEITVNTNTNYSISSFPTTEALTLTLDITKINIDGCCYFELLNVCISFFFLFNYLL
jgi:hypothetical protein